jgi:hypothetical protein
MPLAPSVARESTSIERRAVMTKRGLLGAVAGVSADVAAGSTYEALHGLACTLEPSVTEQNGGGGAARAFTPGR